MVHALDTGLPTEAQNENVRLRRRCRQIMVKHFIGTSPRRCLQCNQPASQPCQYCSDLTIRFASDGQQAWYCSRECREGNRKKHEEKCKQLAQREALCQVGKTLQTIWRQSRQILHEIKIDRVKERSKKLIVYHDKYPEVNGVACVGPFYSASPDLVRGADPKFWAVLTDQTCTDAKYTLTELVELLVKGISKDVRIHEVSLDVKDPALKVVAVGPDGMDRQQSAVHEVWRIELPNSEVYIMDPSGAQFGWYEAVVPWLQYEADRTNRYNTQFPIGRWKVGLDGQALGCTYENPSEGRHQQRGFNVDRRVGAVLVERYQKWDEKNKEKNGKDDITKVPRESRLDFQQALEQLQAHCSEDTAELQLKMEREAKACWGRGEEWTGEASNGSLRGDE